MLSPALAVPRYQGLKIVFEWDPNVCISSDGFVAFMLEAATSFCWCGRSLPDVKLIRGPGPVMAQDVETPSG